MTQDRIEAAITKTAALAQTLLFDKKGAAKGNQHFVAMLAMNTLCKPVSQFKPGPDDDHFRWRGGWFGYDPGMARIYLEAARAGDCVSDGVLCCAAAIMLDATGEIAHRQLRIYAVERLSGELPPPKENGKDKNAYRDAAISGYLIRPLVLDGFSPTRNAATEGESACSIVSQALKRIDVPLSERRLSEIWTEAVRRAPYLTKN